MIALQPGLNADVARRLGTPVGAAFLSILVAFVLSALYIVISRHPFPLGAIAAMPWYLWLGGLFGFAFVAGTLFVAPVLGGALLFAAIVLGQMIAATLADHFGVAGYPGPHDRRLPHHSASCWSWPACSSSTAGDEALLSSPRSGEDETPQ